MTVSFMADDEWSEREQPNGGGGPLLSFDAGSQKEGAELSESHPQLVMMVDEQRRGNEISVEDSTRPIDANLDPKWRELYGNSCLVFSAQSCFRLRIHHVVCNKYFEYGVLALIVLTIWTLILDYPGAQLTAGSRLFIDTVDAVALLIFSLEAFMRMISRGFVMGQYTYLRRSSWNKVDFLTVVILWMAWIFPSGMQALGGSVTSAALRGMRPLRALHLIPFFDPYVPQIMRALKDSVPQLSTVTLMMGLFYLIFGTVGIQMYAGLLTRQCAPASAWAGTGSSGGDLNATTQTVGYYVEVDSGLQPTECPVALRCGADEVCIATPNMFPETRERLDAVEFYGFDNLAQSVITMFIVTTLDEVPYISRPLEDSGSSRSGSIWWICSAMVLLFSLLGANLFVAVITYSFYEARALDPLELAEDEDDEGCLIVSKEEILFRESERQKEKRSLDALLTASGLGSVNEDDDEQGQQGELQAFFGEELNPRFDGEFPFIPCISPLCKRLVLHKAFETTLLYVIVFNALLMSAWHYGMDPDLERIMQLLEIPVILVFLLEVVVKVLGLGWKNYCKVPFNLLDFATALACLASLFITAVDPSYFSAARVMRLIVKISRVMSLSVRVGSQLEGIRFIMRTLIGSWHVIVVVFAFIVFFLIVVSIVTMHTMGLCYLDENGMPPEEGMLDRSNFHKFSASFLTNFQLFTGEDWSGIMFSHMEQCKGRYNPNGLALAFIAIIVLYCFVLKNLFVAVVLENFTLEEAEKIQKQKVMHHKHLSDEQRQQESAVITALSPRAGTPSPRRQRAIVSEKSCGCSKHTWVRSNAMLVCTSKTFDHIILVCIVSCCACLALDGPYQDQSIKDDLHILDRVLLCIFMMEAAIKIVATGFVLYIKDRWNLCDFAIVLMAVIDAGLTDILQISGVELGMLRVFRVARILRVLRLIEYNSGLQVIIGVLLNCLPMVLATLLISFFVFLAYAVTGLHMFGGKFYSCAIMAAQILPDTSEQACEAMIVGGVWENTQYSVFSCVDYITETECAAVPGEWRRGECTLEHLSENQCSSIPGAKWQSFAVDFDNIFNALGALFVCSTTEGWVDIMYRAMDAAGEPGQPPERDASVVSAGTFFISFMVFGSFFVTNLFVGVLVTFFAENNGSGLLTDSQKRWVLSKLLTMKSSFYAPTVPTKGTWRHACHRFLMWQQFDKIVAVAIISNLVLIATEHFPQSEQVALFYTYANLGFMLFYTFEALLRVAGTSVASYVAETWNRVDFVLLIFAWYTALGGAAVSLQGFRALRILRLVSVFKAVDRLNTLLLTIVMSLPAVLNLAAMIALVLFVFSVVAMHLFSGRTYGNILSEAENFDTVSSSMQLLFEVMTGHDFVLLVDDLASQGAPLVAPFFFVFYVSTNYVLTNIFVAVVLENFELNFRASQFELTAADVAAFKRVWDLHTTYPSKRCTAQQIPAMVRDLGIPFQRVREIDYWENRLFIELGIALSVDRHKVSVTFQELLQALFVLYLSEACLPYGLQRQRMVSIFKQQQEAAARLIGIRMRSCMSLRNPPKEFCIYDQQVHDLGIPANMVKYKAAVRTADTIAIHHCVRANKVLGRDPVVQREKQERMRSTGWLRIVEETPSTVGTDASSVPSEPYGPKYLYFVLCNGEVRYHFAQDGRPAGAFHIGGAEINTLLPPTPTPKSSRSGRSMRLSLGSPRLSVRGSVIGPMSAGLATGGIDGGDASSVRESIRFSDSLDSPVTESTSFEVVLNQEPWCKYVLQASTVDDHRRWCGTFSAHSKLPPITPEAQAQLANAFVQTSLLGTIRKRIPGIDRFDAMSRVPTPVQSTREMRNPARTRSRSDDFPELSFDELILPSISAASDGLAAINESGTRRSSVPHLQSHTLTFEVESEV